MVRLKVQEDNIKLKMNAPDGATFRTNEYTPIVSGSSDYNELDNKPSINGHTLEGDQTSEDLDLFSGDYDDLTNKPDLFSGDYDDLTDKPSINGNTLEGDMTAEELGIHMSELINDDGYLKVTDLGVVDPEPYDDDVNVYLNTLTESGWYKFFWDSGDDYSYFAQVQSITYGGVVYVNQHCWGLEESPVAEWVRGFIVEDGEVVSEETSSYMTYESAINTFATKTHTHYRVEGKSVSVWDYCDGSQINMQNGSPILYTDTLNNRQYLIETWRPIRQPVYIYQKVTDLIDCSVFYQRSGLYQSGRTTWGEWEAFHAMTITVEGTDYPITAITKTLVSGVSGVLVDYDDGNGGQLFFADGVGLNTVKTVIEGAIPHDTSDLTNGAGFLTISDLPIYDGGVQ